VCCLLQQFRSAVRRAITFTDGDGLQQRRSVPDLDGDAYCQSVAHTDSDPDGPARDDHR
jgi:hypothetical protein